MDCLSDPSNHLYVYDAMFPFSN